MGSGVTYANNLLGRGVWGTSNGVLGEDDYLRHCLDSFEISLALVQSVQ